MGENCEERVKQLKGKELSSEAEYELKVNSIRRIDPFLKKLDNWYRQMAEHMMSHPKIIGYCVGSA